ncbi:MAG: hypothetical protein AAB466_09855 [Verrucomicrobiota bacterium]|mgnify:CR=1 FL=1
MSIKATIGYPDNVEAAGMIGKNMIQSGYTRTDNPSGVFMAALNQRSFSPTLDFNNVPDADNLNVKGLVTVPLYSGGRNAAGRESARANSEAARQEAEAIRNALGWPQLESTSIR